VRRGAFGQRLADCFRLDRAPVFVSRTLRPCGLAITHIECNVENNGLTTPLPREDALLVTLQIRDCPAHDLWIDGKRVRTRPLRAGTTCIYDLRRTPVVNSISTFRNLHFYLPRRTLAAVSDKGAALRDVLSHDPGEGIEDPVIRSLGMSLLPTFERRDQVTALFVDHVATAVATHVARLLSRASPH
jgi:hypothetical protein